MSDGKPGSPPRSAPDSGVAFDPCGYHIDRTMGEHSGVHTFPQLGRVTAPGVGAGTHMESQVVCRVNIVRVSPSQRRHLARRKRASRTGSCGEHFDTARGVEGRRDATSIYETGH